MKSNNTFNYKIYNSHPTFFHFFFKVDGKNKYVCHILALPGPDLLISNTTKKKGHRLHQ